MTAAPAEDRLESALAAVLARMDSGEAPSDDSLRAAYPDCWSEIRELLRLRERFDAARAATPPPGGRSAAAPVPLRQVPPDRYSHFRVLGQGGMGIVYWALDTDLGREVALKVVRPDAGLPQAAAPAAPLGLASPATGSQTSSAFESLRARFLREACVTAGLEHPGIVPVYEVGQTEGGVPYYTMRFVRGNRTLAQEIASLRGRPADERLLLLDVYLKVCDTVRYAHSHGVIHRDLKPDNVALGEFGEVVVLDWGLAKVQRDQGAGDEPPRRAADGPTAAGVSTDARVLGTPGYMAPEAALGRAAQVDKRSDVHSLGAILFEILTGRLPYEFRTCRELVQAMQDGPPRTAASIDPSVPAEISSICARALAPDQGTRQPSVDALAADIRAWLARCARDREIEGLVREARTARAAAEDLEGDALLRQLDRVQAAATRVLDRSPADASALALIGDIERGRESGIVQRERTARRRALRRVGVTVLAIALGAAIGVTWVVKESKDDAVSARAEAEAALKHARSLALTARSIESESPMCALLLGVAAVEADANPTAVNQLRRAMAASYERAVLRGHTAAVTSAVFTPAGDRIVTGSLDGTVRIWDPRAKGSQVAVIAVPGRVLRFAGLTRRGDAILTVSDDGTMQFWNLDGTARTQPFGAGIRTAELSPAGESLLTTSSDGTVRLWSLAGAAIRRLGTDAERVAAAVWSIAGDRVVTTSQGLRVRVWDLAGNQVAAVPPGDGPVDFSRAFVTGDRIATASDDGTVRVWDLTGVRRFEIAGGRRGIRSVTCSPRGERTVVVETDGTVRLLDREGRAIRLPEPEPNPLRAVLGETSQAETDEVLFSPEGDLVITTRKDGTAQFCAIDDKRAELLLGHAGDRLCASFTADGSRLVTACSVGVARVWDKDGNELAVLRGHTAGILSIAFSAQGDRIVTASEDGTARVWALDTAEPEVHRSVAGLPWPAPPPNPDDAGLVIRRIGNTERDDVDVSGWAGTAKSRTLGPHFNRVVSASYSAGRVHILTVCVDKRARVWTPPGESPVEIMHLDRLTCGAFSPQGSLLAVGDEKGVVHLWTPGRRAAGKLRGPPLVVRRVWFSAEGDRVVAEFEGGTVRVWLVRAADVLARARDLVLRDFTPEEREFDRELLAPPALPPR